MPGDVLLICGECGCASDEHARGWTAFAGDDDEGANHPASRSCAPSAPQSSSNGDPKRHTRTPDCGFPSSRELRQDPPVHCSRE